MLPEHVVAERLAEAIEFDAVDRGGERARGIADAIGLDEHDVELHLVVHVGIGRARVGEQRGQAVAPSLAQLDGHRIARGNGQQLREQGRLLWR